MGCVLDADGSGSLGTGTTGRSGVGFMAVVFGALGAGAVGAGFAICTGFLTDGVTVDFALGISFFKSTVLITFFTGALAAGLLPFVAMVLPVATVDFLVATGFLVAPFWFGFAFDATLALELPLAGLFLGDAAFLFVGVGFLAAFAVGPFPLGAVLPLLREGDIFLAISYSYRWFDEGQGREKPYLRKPIRVVRRTSAFRGSLYLRPLGGNSRRMAR